MKYNNLTTLSFKLDCELDDYTNLNRAYELIENLDYICSYIIKTITNNNVKLWLVKFTICDNEKHNTINITDLLQDVKNLLNNKRYDYIISYKQGSLNTILQLHTSLAKKLAKSQCNRWPQLEYEDCYQTCIMVIIKLFRLDKYITNYLINTAFNNEILLSIRHDKNKPDVLPLDAPINEYSNDKELRVIDILEDVEETIKKEEQERVNNMCKMFLEVKELLIDKYGERRFEQLYNEYKTKNVSPNNRRLMYDIRNYFTKEKLKDYLLKKYF